MIVAIFILRRRAVFLKKKHKYTYLENYLDFSFIKLFFMAKGTIYA